jgi:hypothetical protein
MDGDGYRGKDTRPHTAGPGDGAARPGAGAAGPVDLVVAHVACELHIPLSCGKLYILIPGLMYV